MKFPSWNNFMDGINSFEQDVLRRVSDSEKVVYADKIRLIDRIQKLKDNHPLFDEFIKRSIPFLPTPFNGIAQGIYDSFDGPKKDKFEEVQKFLDKIKGQTKEHYEEITSQLGDMLGEISSIKSIVAKESTLQDIKDILTSIDTPIHQKLESVRNDVRESIQKLTRLQRTFVEEQTRQNLLESNLKLVTPITSFRGGSRNCWKRAYFFDEDIRNGYDARRPITDMILESIENNNATMLFGDAYFGKSVILRRVMFDAIERGYVVVFGDGIEANENQLVELLNRISEDYPKLLLIADNVHRTAGEAVFAAFNRIELGKIRFLFAARERQLEMEKPEIDRAFENIPSEAEYRIGFDLTDAHLFIRQAISVTYDDDATETDDRFALELYRYAEGDPFMFSLGVAYYLSEGKKTYEDFIDLDIEKKIKLLNDKDREYWKAPLLCYILCMAGIPVSLQDSKLLACCGVTPYSLESLVEQDFLIKQVEFKQEQYRVRHEKYAVEFLVHLYSKKFGNDPDLFDQTHGIRALMRCVWDNIVVNRILDIVNLCSSFYEIGGQYTSLSELITAEFVTPYDRFITPPHLSEPEKATLFCYGLGNFYNSRKGYSESLEYYDQSTKINNNFSDAWSNKGVALANLGRYKEAIASFEEAIRIKPDYPESWHNRGAALANLGRYKEAIASYEEAIRIKPDYTDSWYGKGVALGILGRYEKEIGCYEEAIRIKPDHPEAWHNKGVALGILGRYKEAIASFEEDIRIKPDYPESWHNKGVALANLGRYKEAIASYEEAIRIKPDYTDSWYGKGVALANLGRYKEAIASYEEAIRIKPDHAAVWNNKGAALVNLGRIEEAITCFNEVIRIEPDHADLWYRKACLNARSSKIDESLSDLEKAIGIGGGVYIEYAKVEEDFKDISNDPRFIKLTSGGNPES